MPIFSCFLKLFAHTYKSKKSPRGAPEAAFEIYELYIIMMIFKLASHQNNASIGVNMSGIKTAGVIFAVLTLIAPRKLRPIRMRMSDPVEDI